MSNRATWRQTATRAAAIAATLAPAGVALAADPTGDAPNYAIQSLVAVVMCLVVLVIACKRFGRT